MRRTFHVVKKELLELRQDPRIFPIIFLAPVVQLTLLGYAATTDVENVPIVVVDADRSPASRDLIVRFDASPYFTVADVIVDLREIDRWIERGDAWMALAIPPRYGRTMAAGEPAVVQIVADGSDANSANVGLGYASRLVREYAAELTARRTPDRSDPRLEARVRVWFNPQLESRDFMVPGVLAVILMLITAVLSSMAIVREKEVGTLEQLNVTPLGRAELIIGKLLPYAGIGALDVLLVVGVAVFWFEVPLRGSLLLLLSMSGLYVICTLGIGLFVSTITNTQQQAMLSAAFFFLMPMLYLSGFIFPIENMPEAIQPATLLIPLRYYLVIVRGIFLKGVGLDVLWPQAVGLAAWGTLILVLSVARSRKRMG